MKKRRRRQIVLLCILGMCVLDVYIVSFFLCFQRENYTYYFEVPRESLERSGPPATTVLSVRRGLPARKVVYTIYSPLRYALRRKGWAYSLPPGKELQAFEQGVGYSEARP